MVSRGRMPSVVSAFVFFGLAVSGALAQDGAGSWDGVRRITDSIFVVDAEGTNSVVIKGEERLAVIDTGPGPQAAEKVLDAVEKIFGRSDVAIVISTHCHWDHVDGNQVFGDAVIIAHSGCPSAMETAYRDRSQLSSERESSGAPPPPPPGVTLPPPGGTEKVRVAALPREGQRMQAALRERFASVQLTLPAVTFTDQLTVDLGGRVLSLIAYGGGHSTSDILVALPGDGVLISGDVFSRGQLPLVTGDGVPDPARWMAALELVDEAMVVSTIIPGHGPLITPEELRFFERYLSWLVSGVEAAAPGDTADSLVEASLGFKKLPNPLPNGLDLEVATSVHRANVEALLGWSVSTSCRGTPSVGG